MELVFLVDLFDELRPNNEDLQFIVELDYYTQFTILSNATHLLSRCYLRLYLVKYSAEAHKEPSKKYKSNLRTLKSKSYEQCRTQHSLF